MQSDSPFASGFPVLGVMYRASVPIAAACAMFGVGVAMDDANPAKMFFVIFGFVLGLLFAVSVFFESAAKIDLHRLHIYERTPQDTAAAPVEPKPAKHQVEIVRQNGDATGSIIMQEFTAEQVPTEHFIRFLWHNAFAANNPQRRVPAERVLLAHPSFGNRSNAWMDTLTKCGVVEKVDPRDNAARRWADDISLANALAMFGYADDSFKPRPPTPSDPIEQIARLSE